MTITDQSQNSLITIVQQLQFSIKIRFQRKRKPEQLCNQRSWLVLLDPSLKPNQLAEVSSWQKLEWVRVAWNRRNNRPQKLQTRTRCSMVLKVDVLADSEPLCNRKSLATSVLASTTMWFSTGHPTHSSNIATFLPSRMMKRRWRVSNQLSLPFVRFPAKKLGGLLKYGDKATPQGRHLSIRLTSVSSQTT